MSAQAGHAGEAMGHDALTVLANRGYFEGEEILACDQAGPVPLVPKPLTSAAGAAGRFAQAGLHLYRRCCRISLPSRRTPDLAVQQRRRREDAAQLLVQHLRHLPGQGPMHDRRGTPHQALGARGRAGCHAASAGPAARRHADTAADSRASVRHAQGLDGCHPLPHPHPQAGQHGDEPAHAGLQHETGDRHPGRRAIDSSYPSLTGPVEWSTSPAALVVVLGHSAGPKNNNNVPPIATPATRHARAAPSYQCTRTRVFTRPRSNAAVSNGYQRGRYTASTCPKRLYRAPRGQPGSRLLCQSLSLADCRRPRISAHHNSFCLPPHRLHFGRRSSGPDADRCDTVAAIQTLTACAEPETIGQR